MALTLLLASLLALPASAGAASRVIEKQLSLAGRGSTLVRGTITTGTEDAWNFRVGRGKEARVRIVAGAKQVVCDLYDGRSMTANEGVEEGGRGEQRHRHSSMLYRMFLQPFPQCFVHAGLPSLASGLEGCENIKIETDCLRCLSLPGRTTTTDKFFAMHQVGIFKPGIGQFRRIVWINEGIFRSV
jgi:hypothetical protein